jgi:acyl-CoA thioester hydrolase
LSRSVSELPVTHETRIPEAWVDYNGHLRDGYYVVVFSSGIDGLMDLVGIDAAYRDATGCTLYSLEIHVNFLKEVGAGAPVACDVQILDADEKRMQVFQRMVHGETGELLATQDSLQLHVDQTAGPAAAPFREPAATQVQALWDRHRNLPRPELAGRSIGIRRKT